MCTKRPPFIVSLGPPASSDSRRRRRGVADHQLRGDLDDGPRLHPQGQAGRGLAHGREVQAHGRQGRDHAGSVGVVVHAHHGDVLRHPGAFAREPRDQPDRQVVVAAQDRRRP